jgi:hypothetical protein
MHEDETETETMDETLSRIEMALGSIATHARHRAARPAEASPLQEPAAAESGSERGSVAEIATALDELITRLRSAIGPESE